MLYFVQVTQNRTKTRQKFTSTFARRHMGGNWLYFTSAPAKLFFTSFFPAVSDLQFIIFNRQSKDKLNNNVFVTLRCAGISFLPALALEKSALGNLKENREIFSAWSLCNLRSQNNAPRFGGISPVSAVIRRKESRSSEMWGSVESLSHAASCIMHRSQASTNYSCC